ncbi:hypothetical protein LCGC14_0406090 [marine sediment metagenome]|uniref:Uncharacterized protein n=1 Tax=marine sediment metagenome TaxID=412755 RepID=A0A0F9SVB4_9ZZZZ
MPDGFDWRRNLFPWSDPTKASLFQGLLGQRAPAARPIAQLTPRTFDILRGLQPEERAGLVEPPKLTVPQKAAQRRAAEKEAAGVDLGGRGRMGFETFKEALGSLPNENWEVYKNEFGNFDVRRKKATPSITPYQRQQLDLQRQQLEPRDITAFQQEQLLTQREQSRREELFRQQQLGFQQQQLGQAETQFQAQLEFQQEQARFAAEEEERQYRSQLAANPINWLQYSAYTGEPPVIQPWMIPLGFQNVGGDVTPQGLQAGQPIPGFQGQAGQRDIQSFGDLPQLTTPSAQLQARWGPTAQAQFLGYRQARTGAAPQETQFRLGAGRAPTGRFGGFSRFR